MRNIISFAVILCFFLTWLGCSRPHDFNAILFQTDSSAIERITIYPYEGEESIQIFNENGQWFASGPSVSVLLSNEKLQSVFQKISHIEADSIIQNALEAGFFPQNHGTISVKKKDGETFTFQTATGHNGASAYLRFPESGDIFLLAATSQTIATLPQLNIDDFRNTTYTNFEPQDVLEIDFEKGDSLIASLQKDSLGDWVYGDALLVNAQSMDAYLQELSQLRHNEFDDSFDPITDAAEGSKMVISIVLKGKIEPLVLICYNYPDGDKPYILHSSQNKGAYFSSTKGEIFGKSFGGMNLLTGQ